MKITWTADDWYGFGFNGVDDVSVNRELVRKVDLLLGNEEDFSAMLGVNIPLPHHGGSIGMVYRQCFAPTQVLLDVVKDYGKDDQSQDYLWVKAGKYAAAPAQH